MRGRRDPQTTMLAFVDLEERVPRNHPLRVIKQFADRALRELSPVFDQMYAAGGRPSIPPERLLKASLLIALYSIRSETAFCEELDYQLLYLEGRLGLVRSILFEVSAPSAEAATARELAMQAFAGRSFCISCCGRLAKSCSPSTRPSKTPSFSSPRCGRAREPTSRQRR